MSLKNNRRKIHKICCPALCRCSFARCVHSALNVARNGELPVTIRDFCFIQKSEDSTSLPVIDRAKSLSSLQNEKYQTDITVSTIKITPKNILHTLTLSNAPYIVGGSSCVRAEFYDITCTQAKHSCPSFVRQILTK